MTIDQGILELPPKKILEIPRSAENQRHFIIRDEETLSRLLSWARDAQYNLYSIFVADHRLYLDHTYKIFYLLSSAGEDELAILEYFLPDRDHKEYPSITDIFQNANPFEHKICDLFGLIARNDSLLPLPGFLLHPANYPSDFSPLSRRRTLDALRQLLAQHAPDTSKVVYQPPILPKGMFIVPVGPIHAGIIEAGHFPFHVAGEVVEELPVTLGYKHRGIEKLFETHYMLMDGWRLAEKVSGDSAVAHVTAYCQAVEDLAKTELPLVAYQWRTMLLELERMYNHISDIGLLAVGIAYEQAAARLATLRELFVHYINLPLSGHRFLRGLNYPGEVKIPQEIAWNEIRLRLDAVVEEALEIGLKLLQMPNTRERMIGTGSLTKDDGRYAAGLAARASGWYSHDFRLRHPSTVYRSETIQQIIRRTFFSEDVFPPRKVNVYKYDLKGDVFARLAVRVAELETSLYLVQELIKILKDGVLQSSLQVNILDALTLTPENAFGLGYAEGWRGAVIYMVFKGSENTIARCDVCDPSLINWHLFRKAVERQEIEGKPQKKNVSENILADFPLINKSFNLSYAGHDL